MLPSILISTFDNYAAAWKPLGASLERYWPEALGNLYVITNYLEAPMGKTIKVGADKGWASNLATALKQIPSEEVLYLQEDYWLTRRVDSELIERYASYIQEGRADYIRLFPAPKPDGPSALDSKLGVLADDADFRTSLMAAIWKKSVLQGLIHTEESPWDFERRSERSKVFGNRFLSVGKHDDGIEYVYTAILTGAWSKDARRWAKKERISVKWYDLPGYTRRWRVKRFVWEMLGGGRGEGGNRETVFIRLLRTMLVRN